VLEQVVNPDRRTAIFAVLCPSQQCQESGTYTYLEEGFATGYLECPNCHTSYKVTIAPSKRGSTTQQYVMQLKEDQ
jgi:hypothetical protein